MTPATKEMGNLLLAAQPIFDRQDTAHGVELLYRNDLGKSALEVGEDIATSELIYHLNTAIIDRTELLRVPAFINVSTELLLAEPFLPLPPDRVVIELVERITPTPTLINAVRRLHGQGFRFALDDFAFTPDWDPLLSLASYIKVDITSLPLATAKQYRTRLAHLDVQWIAERVETRKEHDAYLALGFDLFQGYFYARPAPVYGKKIPPATLQAMQILSQLMQPEPDTVEIVSLIGSDPQLAIKLTRIAHSAYYPCYGTIVSIRGIVARLGFRQLSSWVTLFGLLDHVHSQYASLALTRAKACEHLAHQEQLDGQTAYFIGLLSTVDLLTGIPSNEFLADLEIDTTIREAVLLHQGSYGSLLNRIEETERRHAQRQPVRNIEEEKLSDLYYQAQHAALELLATLSQETVTE
ncbi:EAL domain-containing protein [Billgrantia tianxiuensis]|jgi:EAL and modified HD-GYP domain-containing signal transduction protein|uniref:EAL domain-containing protein n=1 Tax=Billgrantia tianxiuensis TaxID=2497861 RepID=A0A6I6SP82_9GAMM|nr:MULTISPECIES: EAL domain-containing protein [Halomonas]MCE8034471.1 EAL domain-containing protein [Halomonas sp. MCCC 1A11057]QHC50356.1 EAL domain-containing protein [Halomonas tianxiuensis]